jgi:hypothetical protein
MIIIEGVEMINTPQFAAFTRLKQLVELRLFIQTSIVGHKWMTDQLHLAIEREMKFIENSKETWKLIK